MSGAIPPEIKLNVVLYREGGYWVAHCVELDLLTSDPSRQKVWNDIMAVCRGQMLYAAANDDQFDHLFRPASETLSKMVSLGREEGSMRVDLDGKGEQGFAATHSLMIKFVDAECLTA
jgi:hypothetical protein